MSISFGSSAKKYCFNVYESDCSIFCVHTKRVQSVVVGADGERVFSFLIKIL